MADMTAGTVKKWVPCELYDITGLEDWLNGMAAQGYALGEWPGFFSIGRVPFYPDPSAVRTRYRLEPTIKDGLSLAERKESYRELGWNYVTEAAQIYAVFRCDDPQAPDLYTDPQSFGWAMKRLMGRQWLILAGLLIWLAVVFRNQWRLLFTAPAIIPMNLVLNDLLIPLYAVLVVTVVSVILRDIRRFLFFRRMKQRLSQGEWPKSGGRRYPELRQLLEVAALFAVLLAILLVYRFAGVGRSDTLSGPEDWNFPHITLDEAVPAGADCSSTDGRRGAFRSSLLAPEQYTVVQDGTAVLPGGTRQSAFFTLEYVRTRSPALAGVVLQGKAEERRQALEEYRANWEENTPYIHDHTAAFDFVREDAPAVPGLDEAVRFTFQFSDEDSPRTFYAGRLGNQVVTLYCSGAVDPEGALALLARRLGA